MTETDLLTVSLGTWMELPNLPLKDWKPDVMEAVGGRINVGTVAHYYQAYVKTMSLSDNFDQETVVTCVRKVSNCYPKALEVSKVHNT